MNEVMKHEPRPLDSFESFDTSTEGDSNERFAGALKGTMVKFTNAAQWETANGTAVSDRELIAVSIRRTEVKWGVTLGPPVDSRELQPGEKFRDLKKLNESLPRSEWREGFNGDLEGPWKRQFVLELVDPVTMADYSFPTSTTGGTIACENLTDAIRRMRQFSRQTVYPLVQLTHTPMHTRRWGWRERPHFEIKRWIRSAASRGSRRRWRPCLRNPSLLRRSPSST